MSKAAIEKDLLTFQPQISTAFLDNHHADTCRVCSLSRTADGLKDYDTMTIILDLPPELEARLRAAAAETGMKPEDYAVKLIVEALDALEREEKENAGVGEI